MRWALVALFVITTTEGVAVAECDEKQAAVESASLRANLEHEAGRLRSWKVTWTAIFTGGVVGQIAIAGLLEGDDRRTFDVGAVKAGLGAITTPFLAPRFSVPQRIESESHCEDLVRLRAALAEAGRRQAKGVAWYQHLPGVAVNIAGILYLGLAHDLWVESLLGAAFGTVVGETKLWTQPRRAIDWAERGSNPDSPWIGRIRPQIGPSYIGLQLDF